MTTKTLIESLDYLHGKHILTHYHVTTDICVGKNEWFGDYLKSLPRFNTIRKYEICDKFADDLLKMLSREHNYAAHPNGHRVICIRQPSSYQPLHEWIENYGK